MKTPGSLSNSRSSYTKRSLWPLIAYVVLFFAAWTGWVLYFYPRLQLLGPRTLGYALANLTTRSLIWVVPVVLFVRYVDQRRPLEYLKLVQNWRRGVKVGLVVAALNFAGSVARFGMPHLHTETMTWNTMLGTSCAIGFIEEVPFRGLILQHLEPRCGCLIANLITALLFVLIHLPGWISLGLLRGLTVLTVFLLGIIFGVVFQYSRSLWSAIIAHSTNDFFSVVLWSVG